MDFIRWPISFFLSFWPEKYRTPFEYLSIAVKSHCIHWHAHENIQFVSDLMDLYMQCTICRIFIIIFMHTWNHKNTCQLARICSIVCVCVYVHSGSIRCMGIDGFSVSVHRTSASELGKSHTYEYMYAYYNILWTAYFIHWIVEKSGKFLVEMRFEFGSWWWCPMNKYTSIHLHEFILCTYM